MVKIRVSPERLRSVASSLNSLGQETDSILNNMINTVGNLQGEWTGLAQIDYAQVFRDQVPPMRTRLAETMEHLVNDLRHIADEFERTDRTVAAGIATGAAAGIAAGIVAGPGTSPTTGPNKPGEGGSAPPSPKPKKPSQPEYQLKYDGTNPAPGMNSTYGKPGQIPFKTTPITSQPGNRSSGQYQDAINQFGVGNNPRYTADGNYTYCNTFAGDVARSMGVPLPQKSEFGVKGDRATIGFPQLWDYFTNPNAPVKASDAGWRAVPKTDLSTLSNHVNSGKMAVVVNNGHIAVIQPGQDISSFGSMKIAQAGATCSNDLTLSQGFGSSPEPQIFIID